MKKYLLVPLAIILLIALSACGVPSLGSAPSALSETPAPFTVAPPVEFRPKATSTPEYVRQPPIESSLMCVLSNESDGCVIFFNKTGTMVGVLFDRATREMKWGYDLSLDIEAALLYDKAENRMEVLLLDSNMTEIRIDNGGALGCQGKSNCWREYSITVGIPLEDASTILDSMGKSAMADAIIDARALSAMGQLCFVESGKEISFLLPCHTATSTMIPAPRP